MPPEVVAHFRALARQHATNPLDRNVRIAAIVATLGQCPVKDSPRRVSTVAVTP
jgi:hypothetical protein